MKKEIKKKKKKMKSLYWISVLGNLGILFTILAVFIFFSAIILVIFYFSTEDDEDYQILRKYFPRCLVIGLICLIISIFLPSKKDLYIIYGVGSTIDYIKENPDAQKLPDKTIQVLNKMADDYINKEEK